jgi:muramoyltetrapeptide carboxypeptidase
LKNRNIITPPSLLPGDEVRLVSTARKISAEELNLAIEVIENWGFKVSLGNNIFAEDRQFAGTDLQRMSDFQEALNDNHIKAILCVRGGYGSVRIIDHIDFGNFVTSPKWIAGYSDITVLHSHIHNNCAVETLHCSMPINFRINSPESLQSIENVLKGENLEYIFQSNVFNRSGVVEALVVGGNLSILQGLIGTNSDIDTSGKILFIEDLDEYLYHLDRMMTHLKRAGKLKDLAGLMVGGMSDMRDNNIPFGKNALEIISEAVSDFTYPVCFNFPCGHIDDNRSIRLGAKAKLTIDESTVSFEQ